MNGLYSQVILQQNALNNTNGIIVLKPHVVKLYPTTKVSKPHHLIILTHGIIVLLKQ